MRWAPCVFLALVALGFQMTVAPVIAIHAVRPNFMFVLAVHWALWGPWPDGAIAAWGLGLTVDLLTLAGGGRIGLYAFLFGGAAWAIMQVRQVFFREHPLTLFVLTLVFGWAVELAVEVFRHWLTGTPMQAGTLCWPAFFTALYTAAFAPYGHWVLRRTNGWTGLASGRRS